MSNTLAPHPWETLEKLVVTVDEYRFFRTNGFLVKRNVVARDQVDELVAHCEDLLHGRETLPHIPPFDPDESLRDREKKLLRIHMAHRDHPLWEKYLLHPRVLDVIEALHGPDVSAMQTMMFIKGPGSNGQGFHQDSYYIPTFPDTLIGAWIALDPADTDNGCLRMAKGSQLEPIYPPKNGHGYGDIQLKGIPWVEHVGGYANGDGDELNTLRPMAETYEQVPVILEPGDVAFFAGHVMHRSLSNKTEDRYRRCFVNHYCNARSFTIWDGGNKNHILARGNTHMPFALPKFGTPCAALNPKESVSDRGYVPTMMMATEDGTIEAQEPNLIPHED